MDNKILCKNINIDEYKDAFDYEMTEVILKLKGEFATVSGCGKRYSDTAVEDRSLNVDIKALPDVKLANVAVAFPDTSSVSALVAVPLKESDYHVQPSILSFVPNVSFSAKNYGLPPMEMSSIREVVEKVLSGVDESALAKAKEIANKSYARLCANIELQLPTKLKIPGFSVGNVSTGFDTQKTISMSKIIDIPPVGDISFITPLFTYEVLPAKIAVPQSAPKIPDAKRLIQAKHSKMSFEIPSIPAIINKKVESGAMQPIGQCLSLDTVSIPSITNSLFVSKKVCSLTTKFSSSIKGAIGAVKTPIVTVGPDSAIGKLYDGIKKHGDIKRDKKVRVNVPVIPSIAIHRLSYSEN